uniref:Peptidoglycan D,D-transpeptidase FtsI n=1 Tax=Candidatus Kentrum sp. DK TaxID=2126562 RepID=A0A450S5B2_9GAMM|nr:MAG: Cell division protein FtsI/penicillin-binding protein 2 [Candidatus Kentron sp. DK]
MIRVENTIDFHRPTSTMRRWLVLFVLSLFVAALVWRIGDLQLRDKDFLQMEGQARYLRVVKSPAHRGMILDRNEEALAVSTPVESIWVNPQVLAKRLTADRKNGGMSDSDEKAFVACRATWEPFEKLFDFEKSFEGKAADSGRITAEYLNEHKFELEVFKKSAGWTKRTPAWIAEYLNERRDELKAFEELVGWKKEDFIQKTTRFPCRAGWEAFEKSVGRDEADLRQLIAENPNKQFLYVKRHVNPNVARLVRVIDIEGVSLTREYRRYYPIGEVAAHVVGFTNIDDQGQEGIELVYDEWLRGADGEKRVIQDRLGRFVEDVESIRPPQRGKNLTLSIDERIQYLAYRTLLAGIQRNSARSGSAVVLNVDTGEILAMVNQPSYNPNNWSDRVSSRFRNRAVTDLFEPGSTIKPFTVASALMTGQFRPDTLLDTSPGFFKIGRYVIRDTRNYGTIDVSTIIKKSSNVGASKLAQSTPKEAMWRILSGVGFGDVSLSTLPGEASGSLPHFTEWSDIHQVTLSFGYGLSVTPLQLAKAYSVIASGGLLRAIRIESARGQPPMEGKRILPADVALQIRQMLESVTDLDGTGKQARVDGYRIAGKTGTIRKSVAGGYSHDRYIATFAGFGPVSNPRLVIIVTIDEPSAGEYYGGKVAAPIFSEIMSGGLRLLGIPPDEHSIRARRIVLAGDRIAFREEPLPPEALPFLVSESISQ